MFQGKVRRTPIWILAAASGSLAVTAPVLGQEAEPGDQRLSFGLSQTFGANDNIRLDSESVGTTYFSDTALSFGFTNQTAADTLEFALGGVLRAVNDPVVGTETGFRDPTVALDYTRSSANSRLSLNADYVRRDLAFLNPLQKIVISDQDIYQGGGTLEQYAVGLGVETGLQAPLGLVFNIDSNGRSYSDTTDPLLFPNRTDSAYLASVLRFSPVTQGQLGLFYSAYSADDTTATRRETQTISFDLTHEFSEITVLNLALGHSDVTETFDNLPGVETVTRGPVGEVSVLRQMSNGEISATLGSTLSEVGRQNTLEFNRLMGLPAGGLEFSFGVTQGTGFDPQPIGSLFYTAELPRGEITTGIERYVDISPTLSQATRTSRVIFGYDYVVNELSSLSFDLYYADIEYARDQGNGPGRARGSFNATYTRDVTEDWDLLLGYEYGYYESTSDGPARSSQVTLTLQRDLDIFQ